VPVPRRGSIRCSRKAGRTVTRRWPNAPPPIRRRRKPDAGRGDGLSAADHKAGKALYALRKQMPEPVFGIIKSVMGFRQFSLRGLEKVRGEWKLVTMAWNIKRLFVLAGAV
jgi:hypothetical protein